MIYDDKTSLLFKKEEEYTVLPCKELSPISKGNSKMSKCIEFK